jgi:MarR family transcriptional regulator, organic hydroperoxide resistance regulator
VVRTNADQKLLLENQLCFKLYVASRAIVRAYRTVLDPLGLTYPQYLVLLALWQNDDLTISEIGKRLDLDSGTLTPLLKKLSASGFVTRERSREDERVVRIQLTRKSQLLRKDALAIRNHVVSCIGMKERELQALGYDLVALVDRIEAFADSDAIPAKSIDKVNA